MCYRIEERNEFEAYDKVLIASTHHRVPTKLIIIS